ncbi:hypothetical protein GALL_147520 [mine drainage metagenome]|uniref:Uncharacterized protein n=1 Tax=mine drainage metagenome TaxID=410659 RepID=A0A1J5SGQ6_9ZZZZ
MYADSTLIFLTTYFVNESKGYKLFCKLANIRLVHRKTVRQFGNAYAWSITNFLQYPYLRSGHPAGLLNFTKMLAHGTVNNPEFLEYLQRKPVFVELAQLIASA